MAQEPIARTFNKKKEDREFEDIFHEFNLPFDRIDPWLQITTQSVTKSEGWKLHLSSIPTEASDLLRRIIPSLIKFQVPFKIASNKRTLMALNEGSLGETQIGKFMTLYPEDESKSVALAKELVLSTKEFNGPLIVTDIRLGKIVYTRFGCYAPKIKKDRFGFPIKIINAGGNEISDNYSVPFKLPEGVKNPFSNIELFDEFNLTSESIQKSQLLGPGYLILDVIKSQSKGSVFLAINTATTSKKKIVIIKEGRQHCDSDLQGRDIRHRLKHQYQILESLRHKKYLPNPEKPFQFHSNSYLPMEFVRGASIAELSSSPFAYTKPRKQKKIIDVIIRLTEAIADFHASGFVHRDLTINNIWVRENNTVCLIDLELAFELNSDQIAYGKGTPGFMSPQQESEKAPSVKDDIYSLGACIIFLLTRIEPRRFGYIHEHDRESSFQYLSGIKNTRLSRCLVGCLSPDANNRPDANGLLLALTEFRQSWPFELQKAVVTPSPNVNRDFLKAVYYGMVNETIKDDSDLYVSSKPRDHGEEAFDYKLLRSSNNGMAGFLYALSRFHLYNLSDEHSKGIADKIVDWLLLHHPTEDDQLPGLHFGEAGVALAIAEAINSGLIQSGSWTSDYFNEALNGPLDWPDITHGAAGQGMAALLCDGLIPKLDLKKYAGNAADYLIHQQQSDGSWSLPEGVTSLVGTKFTGFAHGTAGIIYFLTAYYQISKNEEIWKTIEKAVDWLLQNVITEKKYCIWPIQPNDKDIWHWWCHGEAGIALTFLKLYSVTGLNPYKKTARLALNFHSDHLRVSNFSQCHGLSGMGETYIEAFRVLKEERWKNKALRIQTSLQKMAGFNEKRNAATWLVENPYFPTADLMVGNAGVAHFMLRCMHLEDGRISYPLL